MIALKVLEYTDIIMECFSTDQPLLEIWHINAPDSLENCVSRTVKDLQSLEVTVYKLIHNNELVGYFGQEEVNNSLYLTGFFLKPAYRNKEMIALFWEIITKEFNNETFYAAVYKKNTRAINFLLKNNGMKVWDREETVSIMMNWSR